MLNKSNYLQYYELLDQEHIKNTYRELSHIFKALESAHKNVEADITLPDLLAYFWTIYPTADHSVYDDLFVRIRRVSLSPEAGVSLLRDIDKRQAALKLSEHLYLVSQGKADMSSGQKYLDTLQDNTHTHNELQPLSTDLEELLADVYQRPGLRWRLNCLNKSLGSLRDGDFGFIFARPETGKTTFLASEVASMLIQTDRSVCWFNNEEQGQKVVLRIYQAFFGCRLEQLIANTKKYKDEFDRATGGRFRFYDSATLSRNEIERIVSRENPRLVIYDQIDKIKGFNADREDLRLGSIYQWARELAKNSHSVIGVCQADGSAENVKYLNMDNVANAKTSKQAEGDWILGIGKIHDMGSENVRYLNICKNKLFGDPDSDEKLKHGRFETIIEPSVARYKDIIGYA